jgi:hypothetical protein
MNKLTLALLVALTALLVACGGSSASSADSEGRSITVPCVDGVATASFPGESWEAIEASVWYVGPLPANPPADFRPGELETLGGRATITDDGKVEVTCPPTTITGLGMSAPTVAVELYQRD